MAARTAVSGVSGVRSSGRVKVRSEVEHSRACAYSSCSCRSAQIRLETFADFWISSKGERRIEPSHVTLTFSPRRACHGEYAQAESTFRPGHGRLTSRTSPSLDCPTLRTSTGSPVRRPHSPSQSETL